MKKLCTALLFLSIGISAFSSDLASNVKQDGAQLEIKKTSEDQIEVSTTPQAAGKPKPTQLRVDWQDECGNTMAIWVSGPQGTSYGDLWMTAANHAITTINNNGGFLY